MWKDCLTKSTTFYGWSTEATPWVIFLIKKVYLSSSCMKSYPISTMRAVHVFWEHMCWYLFAQETNRLLVVLGEILWLDILIFLNRIKFSFEQLTYIGEFISRNYGQFLYWYYSLSSKHFTTYQIFNIFWVMDQSQLAILLELTVCQTDN